MSRLDFDDLWEHHFGKAKTVNCPCCGIWQIHRDPRGKTRDWVRGHIIHHKNHGPDIYENVRPICYDCNKHDKNYDSNYHYMALGLGRMTLEKANQGIKAISDMYDRQRANLDMVKCLGEVQSTGQPCDKKRKPNSYFCKVHGKKADQQLRRYQRRIMDKELEKLWQDYYNAGIIKDEELSEHLFDMITELQECIDSQK